MLELRGAKAKADLEAEIADRLLRIAQKGERVSIALFRVGDRADDLQYERTILRSCERLGIDVKCSVFSNQDEDALAAAVRDASSDEKTDGVMLFRPFPKADPVLFFRVKKGLLRKSHVSSQGAKRRRISERKDL